MTTEPVPSVTDSWSGILAWLREHAPSTAALLQPPEPGAAVRVEAALGLSLDVHTREWLSVFGGIDYSHGHTEIVDDGTPVDADRMIEVASMQRELMAEYPELQTIPGLPAGAGAAAWIEEFVPIVDLHTSDYLVVDLREGPLRGCVVYYAGEEGVLNDPVHPSVAHLLALMHQSLLTGEERDGLRPEVVDGWLGWTFDEV